MDIIEKIAEAVKQRVEKEYNPILILFAGRKTIVQLNAEANKIAVLRQPCRLTEVLGIPLYKRKGEEEGLWLISIRFSCDERLI